MDAQEGCVLIRGIYAVQGGYMLFMRVILMFRKVLYCLGGYYAVQVGYMGSTRNTLGARVE